MAGPIYFVTSIAPNGFIPDPSNAGKHLLNLSVCLDIDSAALCQQDQETDDAYKVRFNQFYNAFQSLPADFSAPNLHLFLNGANTLFTQLDGFNFPGSCSYNTGELTKIRQYLWANIFPPLQISDQPGTPVAVVRRSVGATNPIGLPGQLTNLNGDPPSPNDLRHYQRSATRHSHARRRGAALRKMEFDARVLEFLASSSSTVRALISDDPFEAQLRTTAFLTQSLDPEEFTNTFQVINKNIILKRLMGLIIDIRVSIDSSHIPQTDNFPSNNPDLTFAVAAGFTNNTILNLMSYIRPVRLNGRYAYLLSPTDQFFTATILRTDLKGASGKPDIETLSFDKVAQDGKLQSAKDKTAEGKTVSTTAKADSLTRGIILYHRRLGEIIKSIDYVRNPDGSIDPNQTLTEDFFVHGQRVATILTDKTGKSHLPVSLTARSIKIKTNNRATLYECGLAEGCIHSDGVVSTMDDQGQEAHYHGGALFEWNGQQLTLKSAFSKATSISRAQQLSDQLKYPDDDGMSKSVGRSQSHLLVDTFPFQKITYNSQNPEPAVQLFYSLPSREGGQRASLLFGNTYSFITYHEYKNGWALPLNDSSQNPGQLTIADFPAIPGMTTAPFMFVPLDNKQPPALFLRRPVSKDPGAPFSEKESLLHLILRSGSSDRENQEISDRHVLPAKASVEQAFWYGMLLRMTNHQSYEWKRKYNCPFKDKAAYDEPDPTTGRPTPCPEGCSFFCGCTAMGDHYPQDHITPNYLPDPSIRGLTLSLSWDADGKYPINIAPVNVPFTDTGLYKPDSCLFRVETAEQGFQVTSSAAGPEIHIHLPDGMSMYANLTNDLFPAQLKLLQQAWWDYYPMHIPKNLLPADIAALRNASVQVQLTHATKEPLVASEIMEFSSTPTDHKMIEHLYTWLKMPQYSEYKIGVNIIASRGKSDNSDQPPGSGFATIVSKAWFERLDAIGKRQFLPGVTPTGALELWMRKEEYVDNPDQYVPASGVSISTVHLPDQPVLSFSNPANAFKREFPIPFSAENLMQMKDPENIGDRPGMRDLYRSLNTTMTLNYDLSTDKFELREYYLRDISKFTGYFTGKPLTTSEQMEEYALPRLATVNRHLDKPSEWRYKVMILNNDPPQKPQISFAVTTIREKRIALGGSNSRSIQRGNIITVYLNRGRFSSGGGERVALFVEAETVYNDLLKNADLISKAGRDILSDRFPNRSAYLQVSDVIIPDDNEYEVGYDPTLGAYYFTPQFDRDKQLWKFEVELDILTADGKQLHNPFVMLALANFQPFSVNYNTQGADSTLDDMTLDCRISNIETSAYCYLLPERNLSVFFHKPGLFGSTGSVRLSIGFDYESLHHFSRNNQTTNEDEWIIRTNFILTVQGSRDGVVWYPVTSSIDGSPADTGTTYHHPLLTASLVQPTNLAAINLSFHKKSTLPSGDTISCCHFRVRFVEVEWFLDTPWTDDPKALQTTFSVETGSDIVENENFRIRYVELIY
jgi:hypothetical protein